MAPLRSSRTTRAGAEHASAPRGRAGGAFDYDPTDGLPVRKYTLETVRVNQDTHVDAHDSSHQKHPADDKSGVPWREQQLPSFFESLAPHSQELLRRARQGDLDAKASVWDRKTGEWVRADKAKSRGIGGDVLKSRHLMNVELDGDKSDVDDDEEDENEDVEELTLPASASGAVAATVNTSKKRKIVTGPEERLIEIKRWVQVPMDKADKMTEPKLLADRRPGLGSVYTPAYIKSITAYGFVVDGANAGAAGIDLGDGGGLGNAVGVTAAGGPGTGAESGNVTPRRNIPPKRKKKKLGGPGRKKNAVIQAEREAAAAAAAAAAAEGREVNAEGEEKTVQGDEVKKEGEEVDGDGDGDEGSADDNDNESEGEGSEEGEVNDDTLPAPAPPADATATATADIPDPSMSVSEVAPAVNDETVTVTEAQTEADAEAATATGPETEAVDAEMKDAPPSAPTAVSDATPEVPAILVDESHPEAEPVIATIIDGPAAGITMASTTTTGTTAAPTTTTTTNLDSITTEAEAEPPIPIPNPNNLIEEVKPEIPLAPESMSERELEEKEKMEGEEREKMEVEEKERDMMDLLGSVEAAVEEGMGQEKGD